MKNCLLLLLSLLCTPFVTAQTSINESVARQTALAFAQHRGAPAKTELRLVSASEIYIYDIDNKGFIIISGNTVLPPVLAYSDQGPFPALEEAPEHFVSWIRHYSEMIDYAVAQGMAPEPSIQEQWDEAMAGRFSTRGTTTVNPLVSTHWDQGCYYNEYCPEGHGGWWGSGPCGHVYAGCVACAMAQVMKYWNHPAQGFGSHSYNHSEYGMQSANFGATTYQWDQMPAEIWSHNDAIATLMYHCGVSVNMNYGVGGSGAQSADVETAVRSYFGYCGAKYHEKRNFDEDTWIEMLKADLDQSHPIYYSGTSESAGHAFVCDGYDNNNLFHFNFGWSGSGDANYSLYDVNGYAGNQAAVINMVPMDIRSDENGIIYVSADGEGNGSSWSSPTPYLEFATFLSSGGNTQVWVKKGTYYGDTNDNENAFYVTKSNKIYGSFNGDEGPDYDLSQRDFVNNATILDGQGVRRVLNQTSAGTSATMAIWDGFVLQNGESGSGSGAFLSGFVTLSHCVIRDNHTNGYGGGVYVTSSGSNNTVTLDNCQIIGNSASLGAGLCDRSNTRLTNCIISNNNASTKGGGAYLYNNATTALKGCLISNNSAAEGGGLYTRGRCQLQNCTVVKNEGQQNAGGIFNEDPLSSYTSCILWGNEPSQNQGQSLFTYCAVQGGMQGDGNLDIPEENDGEEPGVFVRFLQPATQAGITTEETDWSTDSRSICVNRGKPGSAGYAFDLTGQQRILHDRVDIGAYERNASLTLIEQTIYESDTYWFNDRPLQEPGYYTAVYPTPTCDSVVGLTLHVLLGVDELVIDESQVRSVEVFSILGQYLTTVQHPNELKAQLKPGCYLLRLHTSEGILVKKMMIGND